MKVEVFYLAIDCGDGSSSVSFFKSQEELDAYLEAEENDPDVDAPTNPESSGCRTLEFDDAGVLVNSDGPYQPYE